MNSNKKIIGTLLTLTILLLTGCQQQNTVQDFNPLQYVDPHIGSGGHGHVFVGASFPFGMVQPGPTNPTQGWDWCSGYHYSDSILSGFTHTHLSGTGIGDLCDILIMPISDQYKPGKESIYYQNWATQYLHSDEITQPGYYKVQLKDIGVEAELTATERVGLHKYKFNQKGNSRLIIDMITGTGWDRFTDGAIEQKGSNSIIGYRYSSGWAKDQRVYYHMEFSKAITSVEYIKNETLTSKYNTRNQTAIITFEGQGELLIKVALSPTSTEDAYKNLTAELDHWDFNKVLSNTQNSWNKELSKIKISTDDLSVRRIFYTGLYHTMIAPSLYNNSDRSYLGTDKQNHGDPGFDNYTVFSLWDTYRTLHPLFTITQPERITDMIKSMLAIYQQQGKLPVWHLMGCETNTMVGYHAVPVIADAYFKGYRDYDIQLAYEAMKASAMRDESGLVFHKNLTYIPAEKEIESVAKAMEYAIDDWCIAQMAKDLGHKEDYEYYIKRSAAYQLYYDEETRFMRGKLSSGGWRIPFSPLHSSHRDDDYCEGNAWQYLWLVPQDVEGLMALLGGENPFTTKLDSLFSIDSSLEGEASPDITGLIGQYAHGNEPSHHVAYLYAYAGEQWKTAEKTREILKTLYKDAPDGLSGNEDCGQMSAWYVLSAMGMYPVNPAAGIYVFGSPAVDSAEILVANGQTFSISAKNNSPENIYIQSVTLNGMPYSKSYLKHSDLMKGGQLVFEMGHQPNKQYGSMKEDRPQSKIYN